MLPACRWCSRRGGTSGTSFTESSGILPDFPWADACEAKVRTRLLVLIGGILPPVGSDSLLEGNRHHFLALS